MLGIDFLARDTIIRQFHYIEEIFVSATNLKNVHKSIVRTADRLEFFNAVEFALEWPGVLERSAIDDLHGAIGAHDIARQPNLAVAPLPDFADQFMITDFGGGWGLGGCGLD